MILRFIRWKERTKSRSVFVHQHRGLLSVLPAELGGEGASSLLSGGHQKVHLPSVCLQNEMTFLAGVRGENKAV